ncbi:MAG: phosphodiester glycosidase family protein [Oscillospiraceae bacterium]|jgi:exopolysaccharide biosynthesis protein|nr:phosphodiester glycosidase family protein [Oscillospiraceae bacterium]
MKTLKKRIAAAVGAASILASLAVSAAALGAGGAKYIHTTPLASNLNYINTVYWNGDYGREESYILRYTPGGDAFPLIIKDDTVYGRVDLGAALTYAEQTRGRNLLAASNADFFAASTGIPLGMFIEDGIYKSSTETENAIVIRGDGTVSVSESPRVTINLQNETTGTATTINHLNKNRYVSGVPYLFSSAFSTVSTRASGAGWFVRFRILEGSLAIGGTMRLEVSEAAEADGAVPIGDEFLVLTGSGAGGAEYASFAVGDAVTLTVNTSDANLIGAKFAAGAGDLLVRGGAVTGEDLWDKDLLIRSPKTALGVTASGEVIVFVIDGRDATYGNGIKLIDLAAEMKSLGCVTAVNLDGGGSSVMAVRIPGRSAAAVVNRPSDGEPRKVSTYIAFATDNVSDGRPHNLTLSNDGEVVLAGSYTKLNYDATDLAYRPVDAPVDATAETYGDGSVADGYIYTAGTTPGADRLSLRSESTGAVGTGEIFVVTSPTSVTAQDDKGNVLTEVGLSPGQSLTLSPIATFYRKTVTAQAHSFTYSVTEAIGTVTEDGIFTASTRGNRSGEVIVTAGTAEARFKVTISGFEDTIDHWGLAFINDLYGKGIVNGTTAVTYSPENNIKRGDFVLMLYRAVEEPAPLEINAFADVSPDAYYATAIAWAKESGITNGVGEGKFAPDEPLTREQAFTFVYRAMNALGITLPEDFAPELTGFADSDEVAEYAADATAALTALQIVGGSDGKLMPRSPLTRAQMAKILSVTLTFRGKEIEIIVPQPDVPTETPAETETPVETESPEDEIPEDVTPPDVVAVG